MSEEDTNRIIDIVNKSQLSQLELDELINELFAIFTKLPAQTFAVPFINCLKLCFLEEEATSISTTIASAGGTSSRYAKNALKFLTRFVAANLNDVTTTTDTDDGPSKSYVFLNEIVEFVGDCCRPPNANLKVRTSVCRFVEKFLSLIERDVYLDSSLCERITEYLLILTDDKNATVRLLAIRALARLQDASNSVNCPIITKYVYHLETDPNADVRSTVLNKIAVTNETLKRIVNCTRDCSERVRYAAYVLLAGKVRVVKLKIAHRVSLLTHGLKDPDRNVRDAVKTVLLPSWLKHLNDDYVLFLEALDVCVKPLPVIVSALTRLFETRPLSMLVDRLKSLQNDRNVIPYDKLTPETALFWYCAVKYVNNNNNNENIISFPRLTYFCSYVRDYYLKETTDDNDNDNNNDWLWLEKAFILRQLLNLCDLNDELLNDDYGRRTLATLSIDLMKSSRVRCSDLDVIVEVYFKTAADNDLNEAVDRAIVCVISLCAPELDDVVRLVETVNETNSDIPRITQTNTLLVMKSLSIVRQMMLLKRIDNLRPILKSVYKQFVFPYYVIHTSRSDISLSALEIMASYCLKDFEMAVKHFVIFCVEIANERMCIVAMNAVFDLLCRYSDRTASLIGEDMNVVLKRLPITSRLITDRYRTTDNDDLDLDDNNSSSSSSSNNNVEDDDDIGLDRKGLDTDRFMEMLVDLLEDSNEKIRLTAVEGLCKLAFNGICKSPNLIARLILAWFREENTDCAKLQQYLSFFFTQYARTYDNRRIIVQVFLPTMRELFDAPLLSPLSKIDRDAVAKLIVTILHPRLKEHNNSDDDKRFDNNEHNDLAERILIEISTNTFNSDNDVVLCRALSRLELSHTDENIVDLVSRAEKKVKTYRDKTCLKYIRKFHSDVIRRATTDDNRKKKIAGQTSRQTVDDDDDEEKEVEDDDDDEDNSTSFFHVAPTNSRNEVGNDILK